MKSNHHGKNVRRWRKILGMNQEEFAEILNTTQSSISQLEQQSIIDKETLDKISKAISIPVNLLEECDHEDNKEKIVNFFNSGTQTVVETQVNNPLDTIITLYERIIKQTNEIAELKAEIDLLKKK